MRVLSKLLLCFAMIVGLAGISTLPAEAATTRKLTASYSSRTPSTSAKIIVSGKLTKSPKKTVLSIQRLSGTKWVKASGTIKTTNKSGSYKATITMPSTSKVYKFRAYAAKKGKLKAAASSAVSIDVRSRTALALSASTNPVGLGSNLTLSGTVTPIKNTALVSIQQLNGSTWSTIAPAVPVVLGAFTKTFAPTVNKTYRAYFPGSAGLAAAVSPSVAVAVGPAVPPQITTTTLPTGTIGTAYTGGLQTQGNQTGTWTASSALPAPLQLNAGTGAITGTPTASSTSSLTFTFTQAGGGGIASVTLVLQIDPAATTPPTYAAIAAGDNHACRIDTAHKLYCWGYNVNGQVGNTPLNQSPTNQLRAVQIGSATNWTGVSGGSFHTCGVRSDYSMWCWGNNTYGQLGTGNSNWQNQPTKVLSDQHWVYVDVGSNHTCGLTTARTLWCWGFASLGQTGTPGAHPGVPEQVGTASDWTTFSAGASHTCGIRDSGKLYCWGLNSFGQLGNGTNNDTAIPARVGTDSDWTSVDGGSTHTCGIRSGNGGSLYCWGGNATGQLTDNASSGGSTTPLQIGTVWTSVSAGSGATCGVISTGDLLCWGSNGGGQLGIGSTTDAHTATLVGNGWKSVSAGGGFTCGIKSDDTPWCWGMNNNGRIGANAGSLVPPGYTSPLQLIDPM